MFGAGGHVARDVFPDQIPEHLVALCKYIGKRNKGFDKKALENERNVQIRNKIASTLHVAFHFPYHGDNSGEPNRQ